MKEECMNKNKKVYSYQNLFFIIITLLIFLGFLSCSKKEESTIKMFNEIPNLQQNSKNIEYNIHVMATVLKDNSVRLSISTNIPGEIDVMTSISLANQKDDDIWIGDDDRVRIKNGKAEVILGDKRKLPSGEYFAEVNFYPRWGFQDNISRKTNIQKEISTQVPISLKHGNKIAESVLKKENSQKWVMENIISGTSWDPNFWNNKFGKYEEIGVSDRYNPRIIKAYYFKSIDMTLIVNEYKQEIVVWRVGKQNN